MSRRLWILVLGLPVYATALFVMNQFVFWITLSPRDGWRHAWEPISSRDQFVNDILAQSGSWSYLLVPVALVVLTQAVFLLPHAVLTRRRSSSGRSLLWSMIGAAFMAALATASLFLALASLQSLIQGRDGELPADPNSEYFAIAAHWLLPPLLLSWVMWSVILYRFAQRRPGRTLPDRLIGLLLAGTVVETLIVVPIDIMVRRRTDCYCATGTFHSLWLSGLALLWLSGPGALLALTSKRRRTWEELHCPACGYGKGPTPGAVCPECGHAWNEAFRTQQREPPVTPPPAGSA